MYYFAVPEHHPFLRLRLAESMAAPALPQRSSKRASVVARDDNDGREDNHEDIDTWTMTRGQQLRKGGQQNKDNDMRRPTTEGRTMTRGNDDGREDGNSRTSTRG
jgi:hypothetical protein